MSTPLLQVNTLSVSYSGVEAVRNVSLTIAAGQIVTVIGANGAGKSTLLNAIMGVHPGQGDIQFAGASIRQLPVERRVASGLGLVPEKRELFTTMSVMDNLALGAFSHRGGNSAKTTETLEDVFSLFPRLKERKNQLAGTLSGGERQMLAMGRALMGRPKLLMLDEPSLGLAPLIVRDILENVSQLRASGVSILLVEQNARAALRVADYGYVLENGVVTLEGKSADLQSDPRVIESYLGLGKSHSL